METPSVRVALTDEGGGKLTIGGHLVPYESVTIRHDAAGVRLPQITVSLPLVHGVQFAADGWAKVGDETRQALIAMGWTPPAAGQEFPPRTPGERFRTATEIMEHRE